MMSSNHNGLAKPVTKEENQNPGNKKTASTRPQEQALKCPRCDSPNTKFCYYNNYSLTQPRHFCKTCKRYWTKGGALRNVPIGGGCRTNKKIKSSSRFSDESKDSGSTSEIGGLKFFHGLSPAMDFQLGGLSFPRLNPSPTGICSQFSSFENGTNPPCFTLDPSSSSGNNLMGYNYPLSSVTNSVGGAIQEMGSLIVKSSLASSIESLSSINQDLHRRLQQQRLAILFGGENQKESSTSSAHVESQTQNPQPISALGNSRKEGETATEWFFGNSYAQVTNATPTNSSGNGNGDDSTNNWNGVQAWSDLHRYSSLP